MKIHQLTISKMNIVSYLRHLIAIVSVCFVFNLNGQELGYIGGINKIGINPNSFQPIYGFSIGMKINKHVAIETNLFYSQRTIESTNQADYLSFVLFPKVGFFTQRVGIFYAPGLSLNPTLYHSNIKNHTYLSTIQAIGTQFNFGRKIIADLKVGYDYGLTGAYFENGAYKKYQGLAILFGIKCLFGN